MFLLLSPDCTPPYQVHVEVPVERTVYREVPVPVYGEERVVVKEVTVPVEVIREVAVPVEHVVTKEVHVPVEIAMQSETRVGESRVVIGEETRASIGVCCMCVCVCVCVRMCA